MRRVIYSPEAIRDLTEIAEWIGRDSLEAATRVVDDIDAAVRLLTSHPRAGESVDFLVPGMRRTTSRSYVIYYRPTELRIDIVRVVHGARDIGSVFP